ncbi:serine-rich adhesin for platelets-like [Malaya genurostris]|uniref:serine-rich adhesin for platelets-like n=1 Tax=Malaya genurostris TaxID=325434 RepID=UPI0026F386C9|nr:serine-rich adhesin for platelets-like [Malaya genurostris]
MCLVAVSFVSADLGLSISIPNLSSTVKSTIGTGTKVITTANASISVNATLDTTNTVSSLRLVIADIVTPLANLFSGIQNATTDKSGNTDTVISAISDLVTATATAFGTAISDAAALQSVIKSGSYNGLTGNLTAISDTANTLSTVFSDISTLLTQITSAEYAYTANNVSKVITATVVGTITKPLKYIVGNLTTIGTIITAVGKDKQVAIALQAAANASMNSGLKDLVSASTSFNKTVNSLQTSTFRLSTTSLISINNSYATILAKSALYNGGDKTNLTTFLAANIDANTTAMAQVMTSTQSVTETVFTTLSTETSNIASALLLGINNITNTASTSDSKYASACENKYGAMYKQPTVSMARLAPCLSQETSGFSTLLQAVNVQFSGLVYAVGASAVKLNLCTVSNGNCSVSYFADFTAFSDLVTAQYNLLTTLVTTDNNILTARVDNCIVAVSNDIQDVSSAIQNKFGNCLTTGS